MPDRVLETPAHPSVGMFSPGAGVSWWGQRVVTALVRV
jgi:hypothetical protein